MLWIFFGVVLMTDALLVFRRFSLLGDQFERFLVDPTSGLITSAGPLDREERAEYHLTLVARDSSATEPRASAANVTVRVKDLNDNSPRFSSDRYTVHVPDTTAPGKLMMTCLKLK